MWWAILVRCEPRGIFFWWLLQMNFGTYFSLMLTTELSRVKKWQQILFLMKYWWFLMSLWVFFSKEIPVIRAVPLLCSTYTGVFSDIQHCQFTHVLNLTSNIWAKIWLHSSSTLKTLISSQHLALPNILTWLSTYLPPPLYGPSLCWWFRGNTKVPLNTLCWKKAGGLRWVRGWSLPV